FVTALSCPVLATLSLHDALPILPLTLELGGKSPVIISRSADLAKAAFSIAAGKATNGGQICVNPDLVYVPREQLEDFLGVLGTRSEEHTSELQSRGHLVCRLLLE